MAKQNSEIKGIQKKLVAAVAMLLVACIMVVSSSYAWFTLSTAPEVKGIQTSIGSNGNLEMALRTIADVANITNTTSGGVFPAANSFWGNLVDLSDSSYGMSQIKLAPARLNLLANGNINTTAFLKTAVYGTDGRVSALEPNTFAGNFNPTAGTGSGAFVAGQGYGVLGIGTKSGMTPAELALRNARNEMSEVKGSVDFMAETSLRDDAVKLANIIINKELGVTAFTKDDYNNLKTAIDRLQAIVNELDSALVAAVVPVIVVAKPEANISAATITVTASDISITGVDLGNLKNAEDETVDLWTYTGMTALKTQLMAAKGVLDGIQNKIDEAVLPAEKDSYSFEELSTPMTKILSTGDILIDGQTFAQWQSNKVGLGLAISGGKPIKLVNGVYSDIAKFKGNYSVNTTIFVNGSFGEFGDFNNQAIPVNITAEAEAPVGGAYYLTYFVNQLSGLKAEGGESSGDITDLYGYALDLAFRTNAGLVDGQDAKLQLETAAKNRVEGSDATQGYGSYMEFTVASTGYTTTQLKELMKAIRVVFFDRANGAIFGVAGLDTADPTTTDDSSKVKAPLKMYPYTVDGDLLKVDMTTPASSSAITSLVQNMAKGVSVLVYLDGDMVDNGDVGISGNTATGTMNLQFSTNAALDPMDYTFADPNA